MRMLVLPFALWAGVLQILAAPQSLDPYRLIGTAGVLGSLTVLVYRLGVWRQEMENTRNNVGAELRAYREESAENFDRLERHLEGIDHLVSDLPQLRFRVARWQEQTRRRLERLEEGRVQ